MHLIRTPAVRRFLTRGRHRRPHPTPTRGATLRIPLLTGTAAIIQRTAAKLLPTKQTGPAKG